MWFKRKRVRPVLPPQVKQAMVQVAHELEGQPTRAALDAIGNVQLYVDERQVYVLPFNAIPASYLVIAEAVLRAYALRPGSSLKP